MYDAAKIETEGIESYIEGELAPVATSEKSKSTSGNTHSKSTKNSKKKDSAGQETTISENIGTIAAAPPPPTTSKSVTTRKNTGKGAKNSATSSKNTTEDSGKPRKSVFDKFREEETSATPSPIAIDEVAIPMKDLPETVATTIETEKMANQEEMPSATKTTKKTSAKSAKAAAATANNMLPSLEPTPYIKPDSSAIIDEITENQEQLSALINPSSTKSTADSDDEESTPISLETTKNKKIKEKKTRATTSKKTDSDSKSIEEPAATATAVNKKKTKVTKTAETTSDNEETVAKTVKDKKARANKK
jgi:hypothetical protein